jgi:hypothetical protein
MKKHPYVIVKTSSEEEQTEEMIILKFDDEIEDEEKIEVGDTVSFGDTVHLIVEGFTESGWIIPKSNNTVLKYVSSVNPNACSLVKKGTINKDKKIENLQAIISKNYKKIENQANEITLLIQQKEDLKSIIESNNDVTIDVVKSIQDKLNIANNTVALQIEENATLNKIATSLQRSRSSCYEEIERQKVIIEYLESKQCEN